MIRCPECSTEESGIAKFCQECGTRLPYAAPAALPGGDISERVRPYLPRGYVERLMAAGGGMAGERRVVTILFSDVKGSCGRDCEREWARESWR